MNEKVFIYFIIGISNLKKKFIKLVTDPELFKSPNFNLYLKEIKILSSNL